MVRDTTVMTYDAIKSGKEVLFEGAQGTLLDLDMGTYPYVTSSHPVAGGCCIGSGVGPTAINEIMGIFKSYTTRVGEGPFPDRAVRRDRRLHPQCRRRVRYRYRPSAPYRLVRRSRCTLCGSCKRSDRRCHQQDRPAARPAEAQGLRCAQAEERRDRYRVPGKLHGSGRL